MKTPLSEFPPLQPGSFYGEPVPQYRDALNELGEYTIESIPQMAGSIESLTPSPNLNQEVYTVAEKIWNQASNALSATKTLQSYFERQASPTDTGLAQGRLKTIADGFVRDEQTLRDLFGGNNIERLVGLSDGLAKRANNVVRATKDDATGQPQAGKEVASNKAQVFATEVDTGQAEVRQLADGYHGVFANLPNLPSLQAEVDAVLSQPLAPQLAQSKLATIQDTLTRMQAFANFLPQSTQYYVSQLQQSLPRLQTWIQTVDRTKPLQSKSPEV